MRSHEPVTVMFIRTAKQGREADYEAWNKELIRLSEQQAGHVMTSVVAEPDRRYITLQQFRTQTDLETWLDSPERQTRLAQLDALTEDAPEPTALSGMETWFRLPGQSGRAYIPRWKMALVTFCVIYSFVLLASALVLPHIGSLPLPLRSAAIPIVSVPLMTYVVMPRLTRLLGGWLYRQPDQVNGGDGS